MGKRDHGEPGEARQLAACNCSLGSGKHGAADCAWTGEGRVCRRAADTTQPTVINATRHNQRKRS